VIDRTLQHELLEQLRDVFPGFLIFAPIAEEKQKIAAYLGQDGLIDDGVQIGADGHIHFGASAITSAGIDFLADDGGLSAILGVVTVKLHADTIRGLLIKKVDEIALASEEKSALKKHLATLSDVALKAATTDLMQAGLHQMPDAVRWLRTLGAP
jgi:hypothetical protein